MNKIVLAAVAAALIAAASLSGVFKHGAESTSVVANPPTIAMISDAGKESLNKPLSAELAAQEGNHTDVTKAPTASEPTIGVMAGAELQNLKRQDPAAYNQYLAIIYSSITDANNNFKTELLNQDAYQDFIKNYPDANGDVIAGSMSLDDLIEKNPQALDDLIDPNKVPMPATLKYTVHDSAMDAPSV